MYLLARREHSTEELRRKLIAKGFGSDEITELLVGLTEEKLLSDERFSESYLHYRAGKGFGPLYIQARLRERGVNDALITESVDIGAAHWRERAREAQRKRYGAHGLPQDYHERARQARFLHSRGFTAEQINAALKPDDID